MSKLFNYINPICPSCGKLLLKDKVFKLHCDNNKCIQKGEIEYIYNQKPVLINYSESIFKKHDLLKSNGESKLQRSNLNFFLFRLLKNLINGSNRVTKNNILKILDDLSQIKNPKILIIGGGTIGIGVDLLYERFKNNIISFDVYDSESVDFIGDAHSIPFENNTFDFILIQAVLEHVVNPDKVVKEIYRVLKNYGNVYAETPFLQHVHEGCYDFTRFTVLGHRILFQKFQKIKIGYVGGLGQSLLWSIEYFTGSLFRSKNIGKIFKLLFFWLMYFEKIIPDSYNDDGACGVYFYGKKTNQNLENIEHFLNDYQGNQ